MQYSLHDQITDNDEESTVKNNDTNKEVEIASDTIKKIVNEFTESTD